MGLFTKKKSVPEGPPPPQSNNTFQEPPRGVENNSANPYLTSEGFGNGLTGWAPTYEGDYSSPSRGTYRLEPPPDLPPGAWYDERNASFLQRGKVEMLEGGSGWAIQSFENEEKPNPIFNGPPRPDRPTAYMSPSTYRFDVVGMPDGLQTPRQLDGNHFSMASNRRQYPIAGMAPATSWRNTNRVAPPTIGNAGTTDISDTGGMGSNPMVFESPSSNGFGTSYRLSGV